MTLVFVLTLGVGGAGGIAGTEEYTAHVSRKSADGEGGD
jgi:hypothetical protein